MTNELRGLCSKCIKISVINSLGKSKENQCSVCSKNQPQIINNGEAICLECYEKARISMIKSEVTPKLQNRQKTLQNLSLIEKKLTQIDVKSIHQSFFSSKNTLKKIQKFFAQAKSNDIINEIHQRACITSPKITWQKIITFINKIQHIVYVFVTKDYIFGGFHHQAIKNNTKMILTDHEENGVFYCLRDKNKPKFFKVNKGIVQYNDKNKTIIFGDPSILTMTFPDHVKAVTQFLPSNSGIEIQNFYVLKL